MNRWWSRSALVAAFALAAPCAFAQEGEEAPAAKEEESSKQSWALSSFGGLTGYGELISPEVPGGGELGIRASFYGQHQNVEVNERTGGGTFRVEVRAQLYTFQAAVGLMDMVEVSLSLPIIDYELSTNFTVEDQDAGFGNPELAAKFKVPIDLDMISIAAYTRIQLPWGESGVFEPKRFPLEDDDYAEWELGTALGVNMGVATGYMNLAFRLIEGGTQSFRYRFGVAVHPVDMFQLGVYYDGEEFEGSVRSLGTFGASATVFFEPIFISANVEGLILDNAIDDVTTIGAGDDVTGYSYMLMVGGTF